MLAVWCLGLVLVLRVDVLVLFLVLIPGILILVFVLRIAVLLALLASHCYQILCGSDA